MQTLKLILIVGVLIFIVYMQYVIIIEEHDEKHRK